MKSLEALTTESWACSVADGAADDHGRDDEESDLEEHQETRGSGEEPHGVELVWVVVCYYPSVSLRCVYPAVCRRVVFIDVIPMERRKDHNGPSIFSG
uniref:Uncharacterized protein n=1 Tax=Hordeum vulgare subsp. vulgare TaxID=112509 RepID=A0A8I6YGT7_HORVV